VAEALGELGDARALAALRAHAQDPSRAGNLGAVADFISRAIEKIEAGPSTPARVQKKRAASRTSAKKRAASNPRAE
jgi:HEAT repeat protein